MPVYNGAPYLRFSIDSLIDQSFTDWTMLISDNGSIDETQEICKEYVNKDPRIKYYRQESNIGASYNFKYLLDQAKSPYFMWAAADDEWDNDFLSACVRILDNNEGCGMAFSNIVNIDTYGRVIRNYPSFSKFSQKNQLMSVYNFLLDPEILGKPNLIYSMYRLELCKNCWQINPLSNNWGSDICFVLTVLSRSCIEIDDRILFKKRVIRSTDDVSKIDPIVFRFPFFGVFPITKTIQYHSGLIKATSGTRYALLNIMIMSVRVIVAFYSSILNNILKIFKRVNIRFGKYSGSLK